MSDGSVDLKKRRFLTAATTVVGGVGGAMAALPFLLTLQPSERTKAIGAPIELDISKLEVGQMLIGEWRGKPVWVLRRTKETLETLEKLADQLRDPASEVDQQPEYAKNTARAVKAEILVVVGICTHLGCSPKHVAIDVPHDLGSDWPGGFFCPCHGSKFDLAGRVFKGVPAPKNLVVPPYQFLSDTQILIGADGGKA